ncbi:hypothetical protein QCA50_010512 [Cerrena zonata]|uniref:Uncharacterized protein n=1 Tax=Cerrena zonata TaxID=2478898 RepID=A0AAW0FXQ8_9APHY
MLRETSVRFNQEQMQGCSDMDLTRDTGALAQLSAEENESVSSLYTGWNTWANIATYGSSNGGVPVVLFSRLAHAGLKDVRSTLYNRA